MYGLGVDFKRRFGEIFFQMLSSSNLKWVRVEAETMVSGSLFQCSTQNGFAKQILVSLAAD